MKGRKGWNDRETERERERERVMSGRRYVTEKEAEEVPGFVGRKHFVRPFGDSRLAREHGIVVAVVPAALSMRHEIQ
jgi:hypothetical protein